MVSMTKDRRRRAASSPASTVASVARVSCGGSRNSPFVQRLDGLEQPLAAMLRGLGVGGTDGEAKSSVPEIAA